ncbi:MAG: hypothetical protein QXV73_04795 [Candidatus Micrarchaeia archaeon]
MNFEELQQKLKDILLPTISDNLNKGIYNFLNYKKQKIKEFIENQLKEKVEEVFSEYKLDDKDKNEVFEMIYEFLSRYFKEGELIPLYYSPSKNYNYYIPSYNKEDVKLFWLNQEQYYVKTYLYLKDYSFKVKDYNIYFNIVDFENTGDINIIKKNNVFILTNLETPKNSIIKNDKTLIINFSYRKLTEEEEKKYNLENKKPKIKQDKINEIIYKTILDNIDDKQLSELLKKQKGNKPLLLEHISKFVNRNLKDTRDYFIHKNCKQFLMDQFDLFVKSKIIEKINI